MDAYLIQFSVVISGETHNPTILNPDFLAIRNIVPNEWEWDTADQVVTTPALSVVSYTNGLSITVEPNKLQILVPRVQVGDGPPSSKAAEIARRYVETLPHVRYTAVGINFFGAVEVPNPDTYLKDRFLKEGNWHSPAHPLDAIGLRLATHCQMGACSFRWIRGKSSVRMESMKSRTLRSSQTLTFTENVVNIRQTNR